MIRRGAGGEGEGEASLAPLLTEAGEVAGIALSEDERLLLQRHLETLLLWRPRIALVSQTSPSEIVSKHVADCLAAVPFVSGEGVLADLGSGGGFPGLVIAALRPRVRVLLVEAQRRKASFLRAAVLHMGVRNARVLEGRVEDPALGELHGLDWVIARAVWPAAEFFAKALPLLRSGGMALAMKTPGEAGIELPSGYGPMRRHDYRLGGGEGRALLMAEKERST